MAAIFLPVLKLIQEPFFTSQNSERYLLRANGQMPKVSSSESTKCGTAPEYTIAFAEATKVSPGTSTSSLIVTPARRREACRAAVPLITAMACFAPVYLEVSCSKRSTYSPTEEINVLFIQS